ncbi:MAG: FHA domain-containing protein [Verrucomicrobia bacterium]|nr:FHA domain-containing protein [Verrucomicrobiota bacterium]
MTAAWLVILNRKEAEREFELSPAGEMILGRHAGNRIVLEDSQISGKHCQFEFADGAWHVSDLGSRNGTRVNDAAVRGRRQLSDGDVIEVGTIKLRFTQGSKAPPTAMSVEPDEDAPRAAKPVAPIERTVETPAVVAMAVVDDEADAIWFLPGEGDRNAGPFTAEEVAAKLKSGEATPDTPCWREGMADWRSLAQVREFAGSARPRKAVPPAKRVLAAVPEPPDEPSPPPAPDKRQKMIVAGSVAVIVVSLAATVWALFGSSETGSSSRFRTKSSLAKIAAELEQPAPPGAPRSESSRSKPAPPQPAASTVVERATETTAELVIRREDFKFDVGYKELFEHVSLSGAVARTTSESIILSKTQSGGTTLFQRTAKSPDGKTEEQLLTLSQEGLSLYPTATQTGLPLAHVPLPLRVGQTFEFTTLVGRVKARVEGVEKVRVPAGTYQCLLFVEQIETQGRRVEFRVWMAPNAGTVKWSMDGPDGYEENLVKQEFSSPASRFEKPIPPASAPALRKSMRGFLRGGIELLAANDLLSGRVAGKWTREADGLTVLPEKGLQFLQLNLPGEIAGSYDLEVQFTRHTSDQTVGVVLPAGSRLCSVVLSSFAGEASGLEFINEQDVRNNPTTFKPAALNNGQPYTLLVQVRPQGDRVDLTATLDGRPFISWSGAQSSLHSYQGSWEAAPNRASLIAYECSVTFHSVTLRTMAR